MEIKPEVKLLLAEANQELEGFKRWRNYCYFCTKDYLSHDFLLTLTWERKNELENSLEYTWYLFKVLHEANGPSLVGQCSRLVSDSQIYLFVIYLTMFFISNSDYIASNERATGQWWIGKHVEGSGRGLVLGTIPVFAGIRVEILTRDLLNTTRNANH
jgi:hypothetical protein